MTPLPSPATGMEFAAGGAVDSARKSGGKAPQSGVAELTPVEKARERAEAEGLDIERTEHVTTTGEIEFADGTLYVADGPIEKTATVDVEHAENTGLVGTADARLVIPEGDWGYDLMVRGGRNLLVSGVDMDQTAGGGARGRIWLAGENCTIERLETDGLVREPDYSPDEPHDLTGPKFYLPATSEDATNTLRDVDVVGGGVVANQHFGIAAIGVWAGPAHRGVLNIENIRLAEIPCDGIYITNCTGAVNVRDSTFSNVAVAAIRIANGEIENCTVSYDYENSILGNPKTPNHAAVGIMVEAKQGVSDVEIRDTRVHLKNVASSRGALAVRNMTTPGVVTNVGDCEFIVDNANYGDETAPAVRVDSGAAMERIADSGLTGSAQSGVHLWNSSDVAIGSVDNRFSDRRPQSRGDVRQAYS